MEFQDVFLYNFFTGSPCQVGFRALAHSQVHGSHFDNTKNAEICVELKNFYVAITRSRGMLYLVENDITSVRAISDMWGMQGKDRLVDIVLPDDPTLKTRLNEIQNGQSTPDHWAQKGKEFFEQRMYEQASYCYRKAGKSQLQDLCQAFIEERHGRDIIADPAQKKHARIRYLEAARLFEKCERWDRALRCYESIKDFLMAAELCERLSQESERTFDVYGRRAADLFMKADYLTKNAATISAKTYHKNSRIIAFAVFSSAKSSNSLKKSVISLLDEKEHESLYRQFRFYPELTSLLVSQGRLEEAIELSYSQGNWEKIGLLLRQAESRSGSSSDLHFTANRDEYAERALFYDLSVLLIDICEKGNRKNLSFTAILKDRRFKSFPASFQLLGAVTGLLDKILLDVEDNTNEGLPQSPASRLIADLLILRLYLSGKVVSRFRLKLEKAISDIIPRGTQTLWSIQKKCSLPEALLLSLKVVPGGDFGSYLVFPDSAIHQKNESIEQIENDVLIDRTFRLLEGWLGEAYIRHARVKEQEYHDMRICPDYIIRGYCPYRDCRYRRHVNISNKVEMLQKLEFAWSMAVFTRSCRFPNRIADLTERLVSNEIRSQGHRWYQRIFENMLITSDIFQSAYTGSFLIEKKNQAHMRRKGVDYKIKELGLAELRCLDDLEWRTGRLIRNLGDADFWQCLDAWERARALRLHPRHNAELRWAIQKMKEYDRKTMGLLQKMERCMRDPPIRVEAITIFKQYFGYNLQYLTPSDRIHILLNQVDRAVAMIIYIASPDSFVLKTSQVEFLRQNVNLSQHPTQEQSFSASDALVSFVDILNRLFIMADASRHPWYREAMQRRIDSSCIITLLNIRSSRYVSGRIQFMQSFVQRYETKNFLRWQRLQQIADTQRSVEIFLDWAMGKLYDLRLQSFEDPLLFCHNYQDPRATARLRNFNIQMTRLDDYLNRVAESSRTEEGRTDTVIHTSVGLETDLSYPPDEDPVAMEQKRTQAAKVIQKNWRIYSRSLRDRLYVETYPIHRRITAILRSTYPPSTLEDEIALKVCRMITFVLLESTTVARSQLHRLRTRLELSSREKRSSMEDIEKVLEWFDDIQGYLRKLEEVERAAERPLSAGGEQDKGTNSGVSVQRNLFKIFKIGRKSSEDLRKLVEDIEAWIEGPPTR
ncbi:hypothetical protein AA313_de0205531 [Arthrobotrys entomopaga]|nr:hypothetical protein AA313_de0205531 [Arthrobotrys entomopaga]